MHLKKRPDIFQCSYHKILLSVHLDGLNLIIGVMLGDGITESGGRHGNGADNGLHHHYPSAGVENGLRHLHHHSSGRADDGFHHPHHHPSAVADDDAPHPPHHRPSAQADDGLYHHHLHRWFASPTSKTFSVVKRTDQFFVKTRACPALFSQSRYSVS